MKKGAKPMAASSTATLRRRLARIEDRIGDGEATATDRIRRRCIAAELRGRDRGRRLALAVAALAIAGSVQITDRRVAEATATHNSPVVTDRHRVKVFGCESEDSCVADYRGDSHTGDGVWIIRRHRP